MKRTNIYVTDRQHAGLKKLAQRLEVKVAELVRRAVDAFLKQQG